MRLLTLALLLLVPPVQDEKPAFKRSLTLRNNGHEDLPAGVQVVLRLPVRTGGLREASDVLVFHKGKPLPVWSKGIDLWFRLAEPIPEYGKDGGYELRYGGGEVKAEPKQVFDFFDEPAGDALAPESWEVDPRLAVQAKKPGMAVVGIEQRVPEHDPASLILKSPRLKEPFAVDVDLKWELDPKAAFDFAARVEASFRVDVPEETRARCADLLDRLAGDDIEGRKEATRDLIKMGRLASPQLEAFIRSQKGENQAAASAILTRIEQDFPPPVIRCGFSAEENPEGWIRQTRRLGSSRSELANGLRRAGWGFISVERREDGSTSLEWLGMGVAKSRIKGTIGRIRFDFWGGPIKNLGAVWVSRVLIRRPLPFMPEAAFGAEEKLK